MAQDQLPNFTPNPTAFIAAHPICLTQINQALPPPGWVIANNQRNRFTLATGPFGQAPGPGDLPQLRMHPPAVAAGATVAQAPQAALTTIDAYYCHAGNGGTAFNALPYVDIPAVPGAGAAHYLFTTFMNGCSLVIATAVGAGAPALAAGTWRVMHDHDHRALATWQAAGYVLRFASYTDAIQPGPVPGAWAGPVVVSSYNPHNYGWAFMAPGDNVPSVRAVTNFLWWDGAVWRFGSRHFHARGNVALDVDAPPGQVPALSSTQVVTV